MTNPTIADLVISGATVVTDEASFDAAVAIKDGRILAIGEERALPSARETFDATGLYLLPGAVDVHVHFREPGYTHKEDWQTGTAAAAMGGVTTVFEMPNVDPPTATPEGLPLKQEAAKKAHVDCAWQQMKAGCIERFPRARQRALLADGKYSAVFDRDRSIK